MSVPVVSCRHGDPGHSRTRTTATVTGGNRWVRHGVLDALAQPSLSDAHKHTHTVCTHSGRQLANFHILCFFVSPSNTHTLDNHLLRCVCMCVCVCSAIISNHVSVFSLGVCELPPPGRSICVVLAVMVMASKLSILPAVLPPTTSPSPTEAKQ